MNRSRARSSRAVTGWRQLSCSSLVAFLGIGRPRQAPFLCVLLPCRRGDNLPSSRVPPARPPFFPSPRLPRSRSLSPLFGRAPFHRRPRWRHHRSPVTTCQPPVARRHRPPRSRCGSLHSPIFFFRD
ncbi:unnamed protein product [Ixodes hexagonus]